MAILNTPEFLNQKPVPAVNESGEVKEILIEVSPTTVGAAIGATDTVNLMYIPANAVITGIKTSASATTTAKPTIGIAASAAATSLTTQFTPATAAVQTVAVIQDVQNVHADLPAADNSRILALVNTTAALTQTLYVAVQYRASRFGK
jgi:hypothetical protein